MIQATPVVLCGGSGTCLPLLSRTSFPKQFLCLTGKESLFQLCAQRLAKPGRNPLVMKEVQSDSYLGEVVIVRFDDKCRLTKLKKSSGVAPHGCL